MNENIFLPLPKNATCLWAMLRGTTRVLKHRQEGRWFLSVAMDALSGEMAYSVFDEAHLPVAVMRLRTSTLEFAHG